MLPAVVGHAWGFVCTSLIMHIFSLIDGVQIEF
jgi:hypothetical protein